MIQVTNFSFQVKKKTNEIGCKCLTLALSLCKVNEKTRGESVRGGVAMDVSALGVRKADEKKEAGGVTLAPNHCCIRHFH